VSLTEGPASLEPSRRMVGDSEPPRRLRVCYVAPGQNLLSTAGPTRNVLSLAEAMSSHADVTVAFRNVADTGPRSAVEIVKIDSSASSKRLGNDDSAVRGLGFIEFARYQRTVRRFVAEQLRSFDLVLEKSWTLSGFVAHECRKVGVPALVIENLVPVLGQKNARSGLLKRAKIWAGQIATARYLRNAQRVIAETQDLKAAMVSTWGISPERISVVTLGVDQRRFRPLAQAQARQSLGFSAAPTVLLYSGITDQTHDLRPVVGAMCASPRPGVELHVIGDGPLRAELAGQAAAARAPISFHGRVPHDRVPEFIAAADLCLAPYEPSAFPGNKVAYSSLKIPEYMSVGRAVASVPSGRVLELITDGVNGFLFDNTENEWSRFLAELPGRDRLAAMGSAALQSRFDSWDDVARAYLAIGQAEIARARQGASL
jgi:glycosyltransferase involved in cell wall biosynthesis